MIPFAGNTIAVSTLLRFRYRHCCVSVIMRPSDDFINCHLTLGAIWVWDPCTLAQEQDATQNSADAQAVGDVENCYYELKKRSTALPVSCSCKCPPESLTLFRPLATSESRLIQLAAARSLMVVKLLLLLFHHVPNILIFFYAIKTLWFIHKTNECFRVCSVPLNQEFKVK